ncbi:glycosyltransferase [Nitrosophilus kaiyonis]|uniref:glycosyltransferase n=1 Tax=Nitrosophilus kaiyonis TaxID=2930200 RepID=UPI002490381A|nr:glycosyltransferase [Nitrosophilus kaiyonis]
MEKKIKVLHTEWSDGWGGQEIRIINEMEILRELGVELFLATREHAKIKDEAIKRGFKVFTLPFKGSFDFKTFFSLLKIIKENNIDIVNTHSGKDTWVGGLAAKFAKAKFIRTRHLSNPINPSRLNFINELADFIITTGEKVKEDMIKNNRIDPNKIESIPTGVDENIFAPSKCDRKKEREKFGIKDNEIAIGALGVIRSVKRHEDFVEAAKILNEKYNNLKFFIAGDGPGRKRIQNLINSYHLKNFTLLGHIRNPEKYLCAIDILVNSSKSEGVPQAVIQALMMNKVVVATDVGSTKDLFYKNNFLLAKPLNPKDLVQNIEQYILNEKERNKERREFIINNFSKKSMGKKVLNIYKKVLS